MDREQDKDIVALGHSALEANEEHLIALKTHTRRLEAKLEAFDKLLEAVDTINESDLNVGPVVTIPGSVRAIAPIASKELLSPETPFSKDALKRRRYQSFSEVHPMKEKELEALTEAVQAENCRNRALDRQRRGYSAFSDADAQTARNFGLSTEGIDWDRIAEKVSAVYMTTRTARECKIRWLGEQHPEFNHEPWSQEEVLRVKSLAAEFVDGRPDWVAITKRLGTRRTPLDCMRHAAPRNIHQWTTEADERLLKAIRMYGHDNWYLVARYVSEDATPSQCSNRFQKTLDESIKRTAWCSKEDARLSAAVAAYGSSWVDVAAHVPGRHNDQCRDRWTEQLNPSINRSQWSEEEDRSLLGYVHENKSWKKISQHLSNGRTEAMCRNRYAALQKRAATILPVLVDSEVETTSADRTVLPLDLASTSANTLCFKSSFPSPYASPAPPHTECHRPSQLVFLEPVVSSNPESHKYRKSHSSQHITRFETMTTDDVLASNAMTMPPSKKRKTRPHVARSNESSVEAEQELAN